MKREKSRNQATIMKQNRRRICVSVGVTDRDEALDLVKRESVVADVIEVRLDYLDDKVVAPFVSASTVPLLFTNRAEWEGGFFQGPEEERIGFLAEAADAGAAYIDCELRAPVESRLRLKEKTAGTGTKLILSYHDFTTTPTDEELQGVLMAMQEQGADIGKIITTATDYLDVIRVLKLQELASQRNFQLIAFCMGKPGMISRLATVELGGYMTYCSTATGEKTAPGQISGVDLAAMLDHLT